VAQNSEINAGKSGSSARAKHSAPTFAPYMPLMSSAFDTACWLAAA
jgi:hypothetical protein